MSMVDLWEDEKGCILRREKKGSYKSDVWITRSLSMLALGLVNVVFGALLTFQYLDLHQTVIKYAGEGTFSHDFFVATPGEYKVYIQLSNFYQNYLNYTKSISIDQLKGKPTTNVKVCSPLGTQGDKIIYPCGLIANSFFQDGLYIDNKPVDARNITWGSEKNLVKRTEYKIGDIVAPPAWMPYKAVPDLSQNYRFINWITLSPFPTFRKLYGKAYLQRGNHKLKVRSWYPYGNKAVVVSEVGWAGARNLFLSILMLATGCGLCITALL